MPSSGVQTCARSEEHTSELQSHSHLVCRLLLEKKQQDEPARRLRRDAHRRGKVLSPGRDTPNVVDHCVLTPASRAGFSGSGRSGFFFLNDAAPPETSPLPPPAPLPI